MRKIRVLSCACMLLWCSSVFANEESKVEVEKFLALSHMEDVYAQVTNAAIDAQVKANPSLAIYKDAISSFFERYLGYNAIKNDLINIYVSEFTIEELRAINNFYQTPVGQKILKKSPEEFLKIQGLVMQRVREHAPELVQMVKSENERILKLQQSASAINEQIALNTSQPVGCGALEYPRASRRLGEQGTVIIEFLIKEEGGITNATVRQSTGFSRLDQATLTAISTCQYQPVILEGKPVVSRGIIKNTWKIDTGNLK